MTAVPSRSEFEARTNATFSALMWALSRPGLIRQLPVAGPYPILEALVDRECAVHCSDPELSALAARTGAARVEVDAADHVFWGPVADAGLLTLLRCGSDLYPDDGATLLCEAELGGSRRLRLSGPGCDGAVELAVAGLPDGFWEMRARRMRYPMGFELFLLDGDRVVGLPRSTCVEVL